MRDRFWQSLTHHELLLYFFLILAAVRNGLSFYGFDKICSILEISLDHFIDARDALIDKDLLAFDGSMFQVLSLPKRPILIERRILHPGPDMAENDPAAIHRSIALSLKERS